MSTFPRLFRTLVDDAAIFPPGNATLDVAVAQHLGYRSAVFSELVGPFVVSAAALSRLVAEVGKHTVPGGFAIIAVAPSDRVDEVVALVAGSPHLVLAGLDVRLTDEVDPAAELARVIEVCGGPALAALDASPMIYVELPRPGPRPSPSWFATVDAAARAGLRLKFRLGGTTSEAFPTERELAEQISAAVAAKIAFKCTAGLHRAVRHRDLATGFEHHGYLNVLVATAAAVCGAGPDELTALLSNPDGEELAGRLGALSPEDQDAARSYFTSYGSCSITEPLTDLVALDLIDPDYLEMT